MKHVVEDPCIHNREAQICQMLMEEPHANLVKIIAVQCKENHVLELVMEFVPENLTGLLSSLSSRWLRMGMAGMTTLTFQARSSADTP